MKNSSSCSFFLKVVYVLFFLIADQIAHSQTSVSFTTPGTTTWIVPPCVTQITVQVWGGGGGGGSVWSRFNSVSGTGSNCEMGDEICASGGGGGGGGFTQRTYTVVPCQVYTIAVGAGGTTSVNASGENRANNGTNGGNSIFSGPATAGPGTLTGFGGTGGGAANIIRSCNFGCSFNHNGENGAGGAGGGGANGTVTYLGGSGATGAHSASVTDKSGGGGGGAGSNANGGNGLLIAAGLGGNGSGGNGGAGIDQNFGNGYFGTNGNQGNVIGGGGGGACSHNRNSCNSTGNNHRSQTGGNGQRGEVRITYSAVSLTEPTFTTIAPICSGGTFAPLPTTSNNGINGTWSPALNNSATTTYIFTPVCASCADTASRTLTVNPLPTPAVSGTNTICAGQSSTFTASGGATYVWSTGANTAAITVSTAGTYTVTATSASGCTATASRTLTVIPQPVQPITACYETATFNTTTCAWVVSGTQPVQPTTACYETATFNTTSCAWDVTGTQPVQPATACYETATFNTTSCAWVVSGTQPVQPATACYETTTFNTTTCAWVVSGIQPIQPTTACYETATFNTTTCAWVVSGTQPVQPATACYETATFNTTTCAWVVSGTQPVQPSTACYEAATFNTTTCAWVVSGTQPVQPATACYETATFNTTTCQWDVTGTQPVQPTTACYETAIFNTNICQWDVTGTQPVQPATACYETATFNTTTCQWDVTGTQPVQPTLACYETATFNTTTCAWVVSGTQPVQPATACYETATFNTTTCQWVVSGTQPVQPATACYETATFNTTICAWVVSGTQPAQPTLACYETATFNTTTCAWVVSGTQPIVVSIVKGDVSCPGLNDGEATATVSGGSPPYSYLWNNGDNTVSIQNLQVGTYIITVTDVNGCTTSANTNLLELSGVSASGISQNISCYPLQNGAINITATSSFLPLQYSWSNGSSLEDPQGLALGLYSVTIQDAKGCIDSLSFIISNDSVFTIAATPSFSEIDLGETINLSVTGSSDINSVLWTPSIGLDCSNCLNPDASPLNNIIYYVQATDTNGCEASDKVEIVLTSKYLVYIPNVFTPNGDGNNDYFQVFGNKEAWKQFNVMVFDRWGEKVYESNNMNFQWDGTYRGQLLTPTLLVYLINVVYLDNYTGKLFKGSLSLVR